MSKMKFLYGVIGGIALLGSACATEQPTRSAQSIQSGDRIMVSLSNDGTGQLQASAIGVEAEEGGEDDGIDCEQEGEHEGENEGCLPAPSPAPPATTASIIMANFGQDTALDSLSVLDIDIALDGANQPLAAGTYWFAGEYQNDGLFHATVQKTGTSPHLRVLSVVQDVVVHDDGNVTLRMLDQDINVSGSLALTEVQSLEEATENETDGIECVQEGEHQGDNEGC